MGTLYCCHIAASSRGQPIPVGGYRNLRAGLPPRTVAWQAPPNEGGGVLLPDVLQCDRCVTAAHQSPRLRAHLVHSPTATPLILTLFCTCALVLRCRGWCLCGAPVCEQALPKHMGFEVLCWGVWRSVQLNRLCCCTAQRTELQSVLICTN